MPDTAQQKSSDDEQMSREEILEPTESVRREPFESKLRGLMRRGTWSRQSLSVKCMSSSAREPVYPSSSTTQNHAIHKKQQLHTLS
jgi:hypothetical protein